MGLNVYEDLGFPNADAMFVKAGIMVHIQRAIRERRLGKARAAKLLGLEESRLHELLDGQFHDVTAEVLLGYLNRLGQNVEIVVSPRPKDQPPSPGIVVRGALEQSAA